VPLNPIQFQSGLSLDEFLSSYGTEVQCLDALEKARWPEGYQCPKCQAKEHYAFRRGKGRTYQCRACRTQTSLTSGTIFESSNLSLRTWFQAMFFIVTTKTGISDLELMRKIGKPNTTTRRIRDKIQQVMHVREQSTKLSGKVQIDDAYLGGELQGGKRGRGSENKSPFIAAVQVNDDGKPTYAMFSPVSSFSREEVTAWAKQSLVKGTVVVSDGLDCFIGVTEAGCEHERIVVGKERKSTSMECFKWINTVLGNLKTSMSGSYHAIDPKRNAHRYFAEHQYLFNRRFHLPSIFPRLLYACARCGTWTDAALREAAHSC
jgi:transposase-like protein